MGEFRFPDGTTGWLLGQRGHVAGLRKWSETHVKSSGGGGDLDQGTGHVSAPTVTSTSVERVEFWIRPQSGNEIQLAVNVAVRDGHEVAVVWGNSADQQRGDYFYLRNYSTDTDWLLVDNGPFESIYNRHALGPLNKKFWKSLIIPLVMLVLLIATVGMNGTAIFIIAVIALFIFLAHGRERMAAIQHYRSRLFAELRMFTEHLA